MAYPTDTPGSRRTGRKPTKSTFWRWLGIGAWGGGILVLGIHFTTIVALRWVDVPVTAFMARASWSGQDVRYHWTDWEAIAPTLPMAVMAAEDQRFPVHWGFDMGAIADAVSANRSRRRPRGASTITQQTSKNLFLWPDRSWVRKGLEAYTAALLELLWTKQRILEVYLNVAQFGPGVYGVGAAASVYFNRSPSDLTVNEASRLAAVMPNPIRMHADRPSAYVWKRAGDIEALVYRLGGPDRLKAYLAGDAWVFRVPAKPPV